MQAARSYPGGLLTGVEEGILANIYPYLEEHAPDYWAALNVSETAVKQATIAEDTEIVGYIKLRVRAEVKGHDEMNLYLRILTLDADDQIVVKKRGMFKFSGPDTRLRGSLREADPRTTKDYRVRQHFRNSQKFHDGEIVPIDILFVPCSQIFHKGQKLELVIAGYDFLTHQVAGGAANRWTIYNKGQHIFYTGGKYDSHLILPVIPAKAP